MRKYILTTISCMVTALNYANGIQGENNRPILESTKAKSREKLLNLLAGEWVTRCVHVVAQLDIAEYLNDGPKTVKELAQLSESNADSLGRIMRLLASQGIFEETSTGMFANNEVSEMLSKDSSDSLCALTLFYGDIIHQTWDELPESIISGTPAFQLTFKQSVFNYFKENPAKALLFQKAMTEKSTAVINSALIAYNFGQFGTVYDIGGGYGRFMQGILGQYPRVKGLVFDLPEVIENVPQRNPQLDCSRCQLVSGDFFVSVPTGGGAYILKSILHDWEDDKATQILRNCHQAMNKNSRLIIVDVILLPKDQAVYANCMDILMLAITGGKERTLSAFEKILDDSGFVLEQIYPTMTEFSILEARKK